MSPRSIGQTGLAVVAALVLVGASFLATSGDVAYNSQSLLAAVFSGFNSSPSITISRNPNSPSGTIIPGRSQTLAVFDVVPKNMTQLGMLQLLPMQVALSNPSAALSLKDFILTYQYCVPKGNIYAYGYKYGYAGTFCRSQTVAPSAVSLAGGIYSLAFSDPLPVFPDQISSTLTVNATAYFTSNPVLQKPVSVRARVVNGIVPTTTQCRRVTYGYQNRYGYLKCQPVVPIVNSSLAYGNWLLVSRMYGYGTSSGPSSLSVTTDASSPAYQLVAAGSTDVIVGAYKFHATGENINLQKVGLTLTSGSSTDLVKVSLYDGSTKVGEAYFFGTGTAATSTLFQNIQVPKDYDKTLVVKADFAPIGTGQAVAHSGDFIQVNFLNGGGVGVNSGSTIPALGSTSVAGVRLMKSYPVAALDPSLPSDGLADGRLMRFKVAANAFGPIGIKQFSFREASTNVSLSNVALFGYTDSNFSLPLSGQNPGGQIGSAASPSSGALFAVKTLSQPVEIPAGATYYFELRGSVSGAVAGSSVITVLLGDAAPAPGMKAPDSDHFLWSPNSTTTSPFSANDWANGFGVPGLPAGGLIATRSSGGSTASVTESFLATPASGPVPLSVTFTGDTGAGCNGGYYTLNFGDGGSYQIAIPADACKGTFTTTHVYAPSGTYTATLTPQSKTVLSRIITVAATSSPQCSDGIDNDGNGKTDYPTDPGCSSPADTTEASSAPPPAPTATLFISPIAIILGDSATITWSSSNASSCIGTGFPTGNATSGSVEVSPSTTATYSVSCTGSGGSAQAQKTLSVVKSGAGSGGGVGGGLKDPHTNFQ